ncbi:MAG: hypothetical protein ABH829_03245 [archaeon]
MAKKKLSCDKYIVYVLPPSTTFPLIRIRKCNAYGKAGEEIGKGGFSPDNPESIGKAILENSKIVKEWNKTR